MISLHERNERLRIARPLEEVRIHDDPVTDGNLCIVARSAQSRTAVVVHLRRTHRRIMVRLRTAVPVSYDIQPVFIFTELRVI